MKIPLIKLANDASMPQIGIGTFRSAGESCTKQVEIALSLGYRHIDTAFYYNNHKEIAKAIAASKVKRNELFITSKIWYSDLNHDDVLRMGRLACKELGTNYLDLLLIHWPNKNIPINETLRAMKTLRDEGTIRAIGVSNFDIPHLKEALTQAKKIDVKIVCDQVEFHPFFYQKKLLAYCKKNNIVLVAHSQFAKGTVFIDPMISGIAKAHNKSNGQNVLRWLLDKEIVVIPKGSSRAHIAENIDLDFSLSETETKKLDAMKQSRLIIPTFAEFDDI